MSGRTNLYDFPNLLIWVLQAVNYTKCKVFSLLCKDKKSFIIAHWVEWMDSKRLTEKRLRLRRATITCSWIIFVWTNGTSRYVKVLMFLYTIASILSNNKTRNLRLESVIPFIVVYSSLLLQFSFQAFSLVFFL